MRRQTDVPHQQVLPALLGGTAEARPVEEAWALIESRGGARALAARGTAAAAAAVGAAEDAGTDDFQSVQTMRGVLRGLNREPA